MGTRIKPNSREERKVITALCADLAGSTALGARLDPEDAREIIGRGARQVIKVTEEFGGTIKASDPPHQVPAVPGISWEVTTAARSAGRGAVRRQVRSARGVERKGVGWRNH